MTDNEIRIAIAEACGWKPEVRRAEIPEAEFVHEETFWIRGDETRRGPWLPDYCNDLNAMRDAIITLDSPQSTDFLLLINSVVETPENEGRWHTFHTINATARQRAEAFLRALGKWKEASNG